MSQERQEPSPQEEAQENAEAKSEDERQLEEEFSQGGQDVEEQQHDEPDSQA